MAVEVRYHVLRDGKEVAMYATKKEADEHDKMLDIAETLFQFIKKAEDLKLEEGTLEDLTIYLAQNRGDALAILKGTKPKKKIERPVNVKPPKDLKPAKKKTKAA